MNSLTFHLRSHGGGGSERASKLGENSGVVTNGRDPISAVRPCNRGVTRVAAREPEHADVSSVHLIFFQRANLITRTYPFAA